MYTKKNAIIINDWVRKFFADGDGKKSDNKKYDAPPAEGFSIKLDQDTNRNRDQPLATGVRLNIQQKKKDDYGASGVSPAQMGEIIFKGKFRGGNCAESTWLISYYLKLKKLNGWIAIIDDPGDHQFMVFSATKPSWKSVKEMDYMGEDQWIIDPWANIVCKPGEFNQAFTDKMAKWTGKGKRIGLVVDNKRVWTAGSDEKYLKDNLTSPLLYRETG